MMAPRVFALLIGLLAHFFLFAGPGRAAPPGTGGGHEHDPSNGQQNPDIVLVGAEFPVRSSLIESRELESLGDWHFAEPAPTPAWFVHGLGGISHIEFDDGRTSGFYGLLAGYKLWRSWGVVGSLTADHGTGDSVLGTVGLLKAPMLHLDNPWARMTYLLSFDQFWTNRGFDLYLTQFRGEIAYQIDAQRAVGFRFAEPIREERAPAGVVLVDLDRLTPLGSIRIAKNYWAFATMPIGPATVTIDLGALVDPDAFFVGGNAELPFSENVTGFFNGSYDDRGVWTASLGVRIPLGGGRRATVAPCGTGACRDVVRGQVPAEAMIVEGDAGFGGALGLDDGPFVANAEIVMARQRSDPDAIRRKLPRFVVVNVGKNMGNNGAVDLANLPAPQLITLLIQQAGLVPGLGLNAYLADPNFNNLTQTLADLGRFNETCGELATQLQLNAADRLALCN